MKNVINNTNAPQAVGTYSQGVEYNGVYYFSGQIGINPDSGELEKTFDDQLQRVMKNIDALLEGTNLKRENILKTTIFLTDLANFSLVNEAYIGFFKEPYPARSCVQVPALPKGALIEIEVIAAR
ncbi:MAG: RidA family protein [Halobacteriovoraceae bacterium]|nr:RidA family protein [Halobacteriovoraceae bacterium]MCB9094053.1 RidA family protein [Halobacteriovoraceae bacterium]